MNRPIFYTRWTYRWHQSCFELRHKCRSMNEFVYLLNLSTGVGDIHFHQSYWRHEKRLQYSTDNGEIYPFCIGYSLQDPRPLWMTLNSSCRVTVAGVDQRAARIPAPGCFQVRHSPFDWEVLLTITGTFSYLLVQVCDSTMSILPHMIFRSIPGGFVCGLRFSTPTCDPATRH